MGSLMLKIERQAILLPPREREELAEKLMQSIEGLPLNEIEEAWVKVAERRFSSLIKGERKAVSAKQGLKRIRRELGW